MKFKYVEGMIENVDYVECPICHKRVRMITEKHTKLVHNLTKEEFKNKYPNQSLCCSDRRDLTSQKTKEQWKDEDITSRRIQSLRENGKSDSFKKKVSDNSKKMWKREGFKEVKPEKFITDDLVLAKFNVVKDLGYNIIFITEDEVFSESNFLDTIQTSTTILKQ